VREFDLVSGRILAVPHETGAGRTGLPATIPALGVRMFELDLSAGASRLTDAPPGAQVEIELEGWRLQVVSEEPAGPRAIELDGVGPGDWREVHALKDVSGTGRYTARVSIADERLAGLPAAIDLGGLAGSAVVRVGGLVFGPAYGDDTVLSLGDAIENGVEIEIEVRTALRNAAIAGGISPHITSDSSQPHGLIGPVKILVQQGSGS
jgi:hypothetical protein